MTKSNYEIGFCDGYDYAKPNWISVSDKMPTTEVLLLTTSKKILIGDWYNGVWRSPGKNRWDENIESGGFKLVSDLSTKDITHWCEYPNLPNP
jgi:hypothetical protein